MEDLNSYLIKNDDYNNLTNKNDIYKTLVIKETLFPLQTMQYEISDDKMINTINEALKCEQDVFIVQIKNSNVSSPMPKDIYKIGTLAKIKQIVKINNNSLKLIFVGIKRMEIESFACYNPNMEVFLKEFVKDEENQEKLLAIKNLLKDKLNDYSQIDNKKLEIFKSLNIDEEESFIASMVYILYRNEKEKQVLLEKRTFYSQYEDIYKKIVYDMQILKLEQDIQFQVSKNIEKMQKEIFLREQLKVINKELGEDYNEINSYKDLIEKSKMPKTVKSKCYKEIERFEKMSAQSPEANVVRTYLDTLLALPWDSTKTPKINIKEARKVLDTEHYALEKVKERILEYLAVNQLTKELKAPILCLVGPPGVGKTSIVQSIAKAANRKYVAMSLGGVKDEAEIRGHRRTYIAAMPGRIISTILNAKVNNPVFLLDEIDKMSSDFRGDPTSALLEVLDINQNNSFRDHYLDIPFDLSKVMFVATANYIENIPAPLIDRMEILELTGYTNEEKLIIAKKYIIPKKIKSNGLGNYSINISDNSIYKIIDNYTRESGVRSLEKEIDRICRKIAVEVLDNNGTEQKYNIDNNNLEKYLGVEKYDTSQINNYDEVGAVNGLAWTSVGGKLLHVEVAMIPKGKGEIKLTGSLGDVMKESCFAAMTVAKNLAPDYNILPKTFQEYDFHIHFPAGATPKDGPSAGITIVTALISAITKKKVRRDIAMTGEISLRGKILPIGGLKEKLLAAYRAGIKKVIIPVENKKDLKEIPKEALEKLKILVADDIKIVLEAALL